MSRPARASFQQWLPAGDTTTILGATRAIQDVFPYVRIFQSMEGWGLHFYASKQPFDMPGIEQFIARIPQKAVIDFVEWGPYKSAGEMYKAVLTKEVTNQALLNAKHAQPITDDRPLNEHYILRRI